MRQRRALRRAGRPAGELDVDRVAVVQAGADLRHARQGGGIDGGALLRHLVEREPAGAAGAPELDQHLEGRQRRRLQFARARCPHLGREILDHAHVVAGLERLRRHQGFHAHLVERVGDLRATVGRVDGHQDQAGTGSGELGQCPFGAVGRPDADPVARRQTQRQQPGGQSVGAVAQFAERPVDALRRRNQRRLLAPLRHGQVQRLAQRLFHQRRPVRPTQVTELGVHS